LAEGDATVSELAQPFDISLPAISRHLKVLRDAGLITRGRAAQWRPSSLEGAAFKEVNDWAEHYRRFWDVNFDRLDAHLARVRRAQSGRPTRPKGRRRE
jgi:DNA-binding transcriptional ArsR family regulator